MTIGRFASILGLILLSQPLLAKDSSKDPFRDMTFHELKNGMKIVLAPNQDSKNFRFKLVVGFGREEETSQNLQAGHVLEHMLFKDGRIDGNKSYLEIITEAGGDVNAYVTNSHTAYHTTIPADRSEWLVDKFKTMLFSRKLDENELNLGKASVLLEIGKPFILNKIFNADVLKSISRSYFPSESFFESEFGIIPFRYSREEERLSVKNLKLATINQIYRNYYYPSNMTILISGKFNSGKMMNLLHQKFDDIKARQGKVMPEKIATKNTGDYVRVHTAVSGGNSVLKQGIKLFKKSAEEILVVDAYMSYVAHRLMIELRNKKGETYTAYANTTYGNGAGYSYVGFTTPSEKYKANKLFLENLIESEALYGGISNETIKNTIDLYLKQQFEIKDVDANGMMGLAETFREMKKDYGIKKSPYAILAQMTPNDFRAHLKKTFSEEKRYVDEWVEPLFFEYDVVATFLGSIMLSIFMFLPLWKKTEDSESVSWIVKATSTPGMVLEVIGLFLFSLCFNWLLQRPFEYIYESSIIYTSSQVLSTYGDMILSMSLFTGLFMWSMSCFPSKIIFTGKRIVIKSFILKSHTVDLETVNEVRTVKPIEKYRFIFAKYGLMSLLSDPCFWRSSLSIKLNNGSGFIINVKNASDVMKMIQKEQSVSVSTTDIEIQKSDSKVA